MPGPTGANAANELGIDALIREAAGLAASTAAEADRTGAPAMTGLQRFGALGALRLDMNAEPFALGTSARLLEAVAAECLSSAFSLWAHRMVVEYLRAAGGFDDLLEELLSGERAGSIAMATAMQELAGMGSIPTLAAPEGDGYRVTGRIAWASNIAPGTVIVFPARVVAPRAAGSTPSGAERGGYAPEEDSGARVILCAIVGDAGLKTAPVSDLLALGATRSSMLEFDNLRVDPSRVVATSLDACRTRRSTHLTLQSAFCLGIAGRCLTEAAGFLAGPGGILAAHHARLVAQHAQLTETLHTVAADLQLATPQAITLLRYESARLAHAAARHESTLVGGRGYVTTSATNRRLREASFLPVQSPSEIQLLQELEQLGVFPAETYSI
ncbi:hypothetical protein ACR5KS_04890 [Leucobacter sp. W1153]|uniref:hypothetical protein n=1 Tax=Leucobacter sp. W1153 TaxID=3439064 RepID=UPI003F36A87E